MRKVDPYGRKLDCEFCMVHVGEVNCTALKGFYAAKKYPENQCRCCPFYKVKDNRRKKKEE